MKEHKKRIVINIHAHFPCHRSSLSLNPIWFKKLLLRCFHEIMNLRTKTNTQKTGALALSFKICKVITRTLVLKTHRSHAHTHTFIYSPLDKCTHNFAHKTFTNSMLLLFNPALALDLGQILTHLNTLSLFHSSLQALAHTYQIIYTSF